MYHNNQIKAYDKIDNIYSDDILLLLESICKKSSIELVLLGTGKSLKKIPLDLKKFFLDNNKNYEVMNSHSAYNTHNILLSEKRNFISIIKLF